VLRQALIGAYIADAHLGRYNTITVAVFIVLIRHIILIVSAVPGVIEKSQTTLGAFLFAQIVMGFVSVPDFSRRRYPRWSQSSTAAQSSLWWRPSRVSA
jgi:dipeptide/tripeptide permease